MKIRDVELELHPNEALSNAIRRDNDFFEASILDYLGETYHSNGVILDVGANVGNHTVYFARYLAYKAIVAFEPIPDNFTLLLKNIHPYENVVAINAAVGAGDGFVLMEPNTGNMGASQVDKDGSIEVSLVTLDQFNFVDVTLIKMDVESYEPEALAGAKETIEKWHPHILIEDWEQKYGELLPGYMLEKGWDEHHTYLYRWSG